MKSLSGVAYFFCFIRQMFLRWNFAIALILVFGLGSVGEASDGNLDADRLALRGYDPVSYFRDGGPLAGLETLALDHSGAVYRFATEKNREDFLDAPETYEPAFGGWCAWAMLEGDKVEIDPLAYRIFDGKLLIFYNGFWGNTKEKWQKKSKRETELKLFDLASSRWDELRSGSR